MIDPLQKRLVEIGAPEDVRRAVAELADQAVRDPLTNLFNRRFFQEALEQHGCEARRYHRPLSLVLLDLDRMKQVNDRYGHAAGDRVLRCVARCLRETARSADLLCRIGGDEFAVLLPETGLEGARRFVDRFQERLHGETVEGVPVALSASAGVAGGAPGQLFAEADAELLRIKRSRNGVDR